LTAPVRAAALRIIAGRGAARAAVQFAMVALLPVWGVDEFGRYAAAIGTFFWLVLLVTAMEKAALTVLPRTRLTTGRITRMLLARAAVPLAVTAAVALLLAPLGETPALYAAAAVWAAGQGLLSVLATLHRMDGRPGRDSAAFLALAGWVVIASGLAVAGLLRPYAYLLTLIAGVLLDCFVLALGIPALRGRSPRPRRRLGGLLNRRVLLLGLSDVADSCSGSVLYLVIAFAGRPADSAALYLALLVSGALCGLCLLLLRLRQPVTSLRLRGLGGEAGRRRAGRVAGWAAAVTGGAVALALAGVLAAGLSNVDGLAAVGASRLALGTAVAVEMTVFCAVLYAVNLLENTNGAALTVTSSASLLGLATTAVAAVAAIPVLHAVGALLALVTGLAAKSGMLYLRTRPEPVTSWAGRPRAA
jgi:hypothetical protein